MAAVLIRVVLFHVPTGFIDFIHNFLDLCTNRCFLLYSTALPRVPNGVVAGTNLRCRTSLSGVTPRTKCLDKAH